MDNPIQLVIIAILLVGVTFLTVAVIKSLVQPKKLDSIKKLIKNGKYSAADAHCPQVGYEIKNIQCSGKTYEHSSDYSNCAPKARAARFFRRFCSGGFIG